MGEVAAVVWWEKSDGTCVCDGCGVHITGEWIGWKRMSLCSTCFLRYREAYKVGVLELVRMVERDDDG